MRTATNFAEMTPSQLGQMQNHLGLLKDDGKGHKALDPEKFMALTGFGAVEASKAIDVSRPTMYKATIPLKPSTRLTERVIGLVTATDIAYELFNKSAEETTNWMMSPNALLFGASPFEVCMRGDHKPLIEWLLDRAGQSPIVSKG